MARVTTDDLRHDIPTAVPAEVLRSYKPTGDLAVNQLSLEAGQLIWVLEQHDSGWWGGFKDGDTTMGWFPGAMVRLKKGGAQYGAALCTGDSRAVASPLAPRRASVSGLQEKLAEAEEAQRKLQEELEAERRGRRRDADDAQAKESAFRRQLAACASDLERAKRDCSQKEAALVQERDRAEAKVRTAQDDLKRKEAEVNALRARCQQLQETVDQLRAAQQQPQPHQGCAGQRAPSTDVSRRLFSNGAGTPPVPMMGCTSASSVSCPAVPSVPAIAFPSGGGGSARQPVGLSRASPRCPTGSTQGVAWVTQAQAQPGHPPSPQRFQPMGETCVTAPVRSLVSEFERRSNSQGAPPRIDPSPSRQYVVQTATARPVGSAMCRAGSREAPITRTVVPVHRSVEAEASPAEEAPAASFSFGMSPMQRQVHTGPLGSGRVGGAINMSPSAQPSVSVQDRIRQWANR